MKMVKEDFNKRKTELNKYFDYLLMLDKDNPTLHFSDQNGQFIHKIDAELVKILKANGFLLIYNLVESFCRNFTTEILNVIEGKKLTLKKLSPEAQKVWILLKVKQFKDPSTSQETLEKCFHDMMCDIFNNTFIEFNTVTSKIKNEHYDAFGLAGSIDKKKIQKLGYMYGFNPITLPDKEKAGEDLSVIKQSRNKLAHGRITFAECGKDKSIKQMNDYKNNAISYLEGILSNVETYIKAKRFKK